MSKRRRTPRNPIEPRVPAPKELRVGVWTESKDIIGNSLGYEAISRLVGHLDTINTLAVLAKACWHAEKEGSDPRTQLFMATQFLTRSQIVQAQNVIIYQGKVLFFAQQFRVLMKYVAQYSRVTTEPHPLEPDNYKTLGLALLAVSDLLTAVAERSKPKILTPDPIENVIFDLLSSSYYVRSPALLLGFVRSRQMYVNIHNQPDGKLHPDYTDLEREFNVAVGMTLGDYLSVGLGLFAYFLKFLDKNPPQNNFDFIVFDPRQWFSGSKLPSTAIDHLLKIISMSLLEFKEAVRGQDRREMAFDFLTMREKPLLRLTDNLFLPFSLLYLVERLTTGVYWILFDYIGRTQGDQAKEKLSRYNGFLFERYVEYLCQQIHSRIGPLGEKLITNRVYHIGKQEYRTPDDVFVGDDYAVLIEASAARMQAKKSTSLGDLSAIRSDLDKMVFDKAAQLDTFIKNVKTNRVVVDGINASTIKTWYPVIVLIEGFPRFPVMDAYVSNELKRRKLLDGTETMPLSVIDIEDLENMAIFGQTKLADALKSWRANPKFMLTSLAEHISPIDKEKSEQWFRRLVDETFGEVTQLLLGRPFSEIINEADS